MRFRFLNMKMRIKSTKGERLGMSNLNKVKFNRQKLYDEIWKLSATGVAKKNNLHYTKLINSLKENHIPYPSSGYWTRLACGKDVTNEILPLPEAEKDEIYLYPADYSAIEKSKKVEAHSDKEVDSSNNFVEANEDNIIVTDTEEKIIVPDNVLSSLDEEDRKTVIKAIEEIHVKVNSKVHPVLTAYKKTIEEWKQKQKENSDIRRSYYRRGVKIEQPIFMNEVSASGLNRVIAILDAIYKTIEKLGGEIKSDLSMKIGTDVVKVAFAEGQGKKAHEITKQEAKELLEYKDKVKFGGYASKPHIKKYDYFYNGKLRLKFDDSSYMRDNEQQKLEERIGEIIVKLYEISEEHRIEREKREEAHRKYLEEKKKEELRAKRIEEEKKKIQELVNEAKDYQTACEIRAYIESIKSRGELREATIQWIEWAKEKAEWFDPTISREDEYLGKRRHALSEEEKQLIRERRDGFYY